MGSAVTLILQHSNVHPCRSEGFGVCWTPSYQYATLPVVSFIRAVPSTDASERSTVLTLRSLFPCGRSRYRLVTQTYSDRSVFSVLFLRVLVFKRFPVSPCNTAFP